MMNKYSKVHCFFEQSGTFKNQFKELGYIAYDYDIKNDFNETDYVIDLFGEIERAYDEKKSIFDSISKNDLIFAFFPCTRFENQIQMGFRGDLYQFSKKTLCDKLEYCLTLHQELSRLYNLVTKLAIICDKRKLPLIIENPYSSQHYLTKYWCIKPLVIDQDRRMRGDFFAKPTQYFFINCVPSFNFVDEPLDIKINTKTIEKTRNQVERSLISQSYARRFIKEFVL